jgi:hypothetical protein
LPIVGNNTGCSSPVTHPAHPPPINNDGSPYQLSRGGKPWLALRKELG